MHKKQLIIVNGTMGVGKSATCEELFKALENCVYLEGDWCWMMNPFVVNAESRKMVEDNIIHVLRNFLSYPSFQYVIFGWVLHLEEIHDRILKGLEDLDFNLIRITLICSEDSLRHRFMKDMNAKLRDHNSLEESTKRLKLYQSMDTIKIDTTDISAAVASQQIMRILLERESNGHIGTAPAQV